MICKRRDRNAEVINFYRVLKNDFAALKREIDAFTEVYSQRLEHASIFCREALDVICKADHEDTFHYVDPPYFQANMGHYGDYTREDFAALLETLSRVKGKFMLSSYPSDVLREYADRHGWCVMKFVMPRSAGGGIKTEVVTLNYTTPTMVRKRKEM